MKKGDVVILKNKKPATYIGPTSHQPNKPHLVKLASGDHVQLMPGVDFFTQEQADSMKASKVKKKAYPAKRIEQWKVELKALEEEWEDVYKQQDAEAGQYENLDDFEKEGKHNEYGGLLNNIEEKIGALKAKISKYEPIDEAHHKHHKHKHHRHTGAQYHGFGGYRPYGYGYYGGGGGFHDNDNDNDHDGDDDADDTGGGAPAPASGGISECIKLLEELTKEKVILI